MDKALRDIKNLNPSGDVFEVSCLKQDGLADWTNWLRARLEERHGK